MVERRKFLQLTGFGVAGAALGGLAGCDGVWSTISKELGARVPPYAVTVLIPLLDLNEETGSTQIWEGSHRLGRNDEVRGQPTNADVRAGSCLAFDYRLYHGGTPTLGESPRPVLYLVYSRPWFRDSKNFFSHPPLPITEGEKAALPAKHRPLFRFGDMV